MTSISNVSSAALAILQQLNNRTMRSEQPPSATDNLIAVATGQTNKVAVSKQPTQALSNVSEAIFGTNTKVELTKMKLDLIYRVGKALGVDRDDYPSMDDFAKAMQKAADALNLSEVNKIEHDLDLNKLGLSLKDVVNSAEDPERNDKVTRALKQQMDKTNGEEGNAQASQSAIVGLDDVGLYGLAAVK